MSDDNRCHDRWTLAETGECQYCGDRALVLPEPFGQQDACRPHWEQIVYGEGE
jgi:hypothetical protein